MDQDREGHQYKTVTSELIALVLKISHLTSASVSKIAIEEEIVQSHRLPKHSARRLIRQVHQELKNIELDASILRPPTTYEQIIADMEITKASRLMSN